jgi:glutamate/aspartate transport system substrate-binding protein
VGDEGWHSVVMTTKPRPERGQGATRRDAALALLALACPPLQARAPLRLRTCSQSDLPLKFDLGNPARPGICVEIIQALQRLDPGLQFLGLERDLPLKRVAQELANHELDLFFSMIDTPQRLRLGVDFLDEPVLYESRHQVAVRADDPIQVRSLRDIAALGDQGVVLVTYGTAYAEYLKDQPGLQLSHLTLSNHKNLEMLLRGRGRFFYHAGSTLRSQIALDGLEDRVRVLPAVFKVDAQRLAFSPRLVPGARQRVVSALRQLEQRGELQALRERYGVV